MIFKPLVSKLLCHFLIEFAQRGTMRAYKIMFVDDFFSPETYIVICET